MHLLMALLHDVAGYGVCVGGGAEILLFEVVELLLLLWLLLLMLLLLLLMLLEVLLLLVLGLCIAALLTDYAGRSTAVHGLLLALVLVLVRWDKLGGLLLVVLHLGQLVVELIEAILGVICLVLVPTAAWHWLRRKRHLLLVEGV